jgi:phosphinothricin acetyltransferase
MRRPDWAAVAEIYGQGLETGDATFETGVPTWEEWDASHLSAPRLVARAERTVVGWAALSPVSERCVYAGVAEDSVYVARDARGRGIGRALLERLVREADNAGLWTLQAGIFPENRASVALHQRCGFRIVGVRERLGQRDGVWRDVLLLERRSRRGASPASSSSPRSRRSAPRGRAA